MRKTYPNKGIFVPIYKTQVDSRHAFHFLFSEIVGRAIKGKSTTNITTSSYTEADKTVLSQAIGYIGIVVFAVELSLIILVDLPKLILDIKTGYTNLTNTVTKKLSKRKANKKLKKKKFAKRRKSSSVASVSSNDSTEVIIKSDPFDILLQDINV